MEEILLRFPKLGQDIFNQINDQSLVASRKVNKVWNTFLDNNRFFWIRVIKSYRRNQVGYEKEWKAILEKIPLETSREISLSSACRGEEESLQSSGATCRAFIQYAWAVEEKKRPTSFDRQLMVW